MKTQKGFMLIHFTKKCVNLDLWANTRQELEDSLKSLLSDNKDAKVVPCYKDNGSTYLEINPNNFIRIE